MNCEFPEGRSREYCVAEERKEGSYITLATVSTIRSLYSGLVSDSEVFLK